MPLSLSKLERLFSSKGLVIKKYFIMYSLCVYLEIFNTRSSDKFLLYIPSKYEIKLERGNNVYTVSYLNIIDENGNIPGDYAGEPGNYELEKNYDEIEIGLSPDTGSHKNLVKHLEENYKHPLSLKDIDRDDTQCLRDIFRQLRRFKFCVQSIKYKLGIVYKNYLCCIRRDDTFECFVIQKYPKNVEKRLFVTLDLETLYSKLNSVSVDIKTVRNGIYKVLNKNHLRNSKNLRNMLEKNISIVNRSDDFYIQKERFGLYITNLESMLEKVDISEKKVLEKLEKLNEKYSDPGLRGLHIDIEKSHLISKQEAELEKVNGVRREIVKNIDEMKEKQETLMLNIDKVFFDNSIMLDAMIKNINSLEII